MTHRRFDADWSEEATLAGGAQVTLRLLRPSDKELLLRGFEHLSTESRYRRFHAAKASLTAAELRYLTELDGEDHFAIGAVARTDGAEEGVAVARCIRLRDRRDVAEAAITVVDTWQGRGLGRLLLHRLMDAGWERGLRALRGSVLPGNDPMRHLMAGAAPDVIQVTEADGVVSFDVPLQPPPSASAQVLERLLKLFAEGVVSLLTSLRLADEPPRDQP